VLIDLHTHIQSSERTAADFLGFLGREPAGGLATLAHARAEMDRAGVDRVLVVPWMPAQDLVDERAAGPDDRGPVTDQVLAEWSDYNGWAVEAANADPDRVSCLVGLDPVLMGVDAVRREVALRVGQGAAGLKISPMFLGVTLDHPGLDIVWTLALEYGVFVLVEAETSSFRGRPVQGHPSALWTVLERHPTLTVQIAHLSRGGEEEVAALASRYPRVHADLAQRLTGPAGDGWTPDRLAATIRSIGVERVVYGTNYPLTDMAASATAFEALPLSAEEKALVGHLNAERLLAMRGRSDV
jgi:predicted TIM-barrel fold metal-dependent hydrolase